MSENEKTPQEVSREEWNFSPFTGEKLNNTCPNCWVKKRPYNCGHEMCPGNKLLTEEVKVLET